MDAKKKTIMVILDGLDYEYIEKNLKQFPFYKKLYENKKLCPLESVVPADSIPSWTTIYTGLNPAEHGVLESIDYLDFKNKIKGDYSVIQGHSFWDVLSKEGKKVFIFNPFMAYPAWDVNGLMICGPVFEGGGVSTNRPDLVDMKSMPSIGGMVDHPTDKEMSRFRKQWNFHKSSLILSISIFKRMFTISLFWVSQLRIECSIFCGGIRIRETGLIREKINFRMQSLRCISSWRKMSKG